MLFAEQDQPELAILHYKEAVNQIEVIRAELGTQPLELQQSYTRTVAETYRALADLLLQQGRIPEAQQVLDLLKLEELREFTGNTRAIWNSEWLQYTAMEQPVVDAHGSLIALGQKIYECRQIQCGELNRLREEQRTLTTAYENQVANFETEIVQGERADNQFQDPRDLSDGAYDLLQANPNALLIYPFVTEEKLWLLWASAGGSVGSIAIEDATQAELSRLVQQFGAQLRSPGDLEALQTTSYRLYQWLIQPLEAELEKNNIQQLIFVNDRVTRYIPMAALFDGDRYLAERYTISTVITPGTTNTDKNIAWVDEAEALAVGLTQAVGEFSALPAVAVELDAIVRSDPDDALGIYPGQVFLNDDFTLELMQSNIEFKQILHIASHAEFAPSRPEDSFIVLGNNQKLSFPEIETMQESLRDLHLVVLSACETALGGTTGDGTEIAGISSYFLAENRAETVIASLWAVDDISTSILMQRFYQLLATGELTKAEALNKPN
jgi:CHAT domain-containing protein